MENDIPKQTRICIELHGKRKWYTHEDAYKVLKLDCWAVVIVPYCGYNENKEYEAGELFNLWQLQVKELKKFLVKHNLSIQL